LNLRPPAPHAGALAELRYAPERDIIFELGSFEQSRNEEAIIGFRT
jgi:hypothetical protein